MTTTASYSISFAVMFELVRVNGQLQAVASGTVTQRASGTNESMTMSFDITKAG